MPRKYEESRFAWGLTGSGHFLEECLEYLMAIENVDVFLSRAVEEVLVMYKYIDKLRESGIRMFHDSTASAVPVGQLYEGNYHTLIVAPATSNTIAKCVAGISDLFFCRRIYISLHIYPEPVTVRVLLRCFES